MLSEILLNINPDVILTTQISSSKNQSEKYENKVLFFTSSKKKVKKYLDSEFNEEIHFIGAWNYTQKTHSEIERILNTSLTPKKGMCFISEMIVKKHAGNQKAVPVAVCPGFGSRNYYGIKDKLIIGYINTDQMLDEKIKEGIVKCR